MIDNCSARKKEAGVLEETLAAKKEAQLLLELVKEFTGTLTPTSGGDEKRAKVPPLVEIQENIHDIGQLIEETRILIKNEVIDRII